MRDPAAAIEFYSRIFGAEELLRLTEPNGRIAHAELKLGPAVVMLQETALRNSNSTSLPLPAVSTG